MSTGGVSKPGLRPTTTTPTSGTSAPAKPATGNIGAETTQKGHNTRDTMISLSQSTSTQANIQASNSNTGAAVAQTSSDSVSDGTKTTEASKPTSTQHVVGNQRVNDDVKTKSRGVSSGDKAASE